MKAAKSRIHIYAFISFCENFPLNREFRPLCNFLFTKVRDQGLVLQDTITYNPLVIENTICEGVYVYLNTKTRYSLVNNLYTRNNLKVSSKLYSCSANLSTILLLLISAHCCSDSAFEIGVLLSLLVWRQWSFSLTIS